MTTQRHIVQQGAAAQAGRQGEGEERKKGVGEEDEGWDEQQYRH